MTLKQFIKDNKEEIDRAIKDTCPDCRLNNRERELWVRNDEGLWQWARSEGVRV